MGGMDAMQTRGMDRAACSWWQRARTPAGAETLKKSKEAAAVTPATVGTHQEQDPSKSGDVSDR